MNFDWTCEMCGEQFPFKDDDGHDIVPNRLDSCYMDRTGRVVQNYLGDYCDDCYPAVRANHTCTGCGKVHDNDLTDSDGLCSDCFDKAQA